MKAAVLLCACLALATTVNAVTKGRLVISKTDDSLITVIDLDTLSQVGSLTDVGSRAAVYTTDDGVFAVVSHSSQGVIRFVDSGLTYNSDGSMAVKHSPHFTSFESTGTKPAHVNSNLGWTVVHYDGDRAQDIDSKVVALRESELDVASPDEIKFPPMGPQHGVAWGAPGCHFILSEPTEEYLSGEISSSLPNTFRVVHAQNPDVVVQRFVDACKGYHGSATMGNMFAFGCLSSTPTTTSPFTDTGVLLLTYDPASKTFSSKKITYPAGTANRVGTIVANPAFASFIGNWDAGRLIRIDPAATAMTTSDIINIGSPFCQWIQDVKTGSRVYALHANNTISVTSLTTFERIATIEFAEHLGGYTCSSAGRPFLAVAEDYLYISHKFSSTAYQVQEYSLVDFKLTNTFNVNYAIHQFSVAGLYHPHDAEDSADCLDPHNSSAGRNVAGALALAATSVALFAWL